MDYKHTQWYRDFHERSILFGYRGSQAHGTWRPPTEPDSIDDVDLMGVVINPIEAYLGLGCLPGTGRQETYERMEQDPATGLLWDIVVYDIRHFVHLLCKQNPNVLSMLWLSPNHYTRMTPAGELLIRNRDVFASKQAYNSFIGYARSQAGKMEWNSCMGYMGAKRKQLVEKHGYDTKNASHLIRILRMGSEFLSMGQLNVEREDNAYLVEIKRGHYTLEQIKAEADRLFHLNDSALANSRLPDRVDQAKAEAMLVGILSEAFGIRKSEVRL